MVVSPLRILFVCRFLPHAKALDSGGQDTYHHLLELSKRHKVSIIAFVKSEEQESLCELKKICTHVVGVPYNASALPDRLWRAFWRTIYPKVYGRVFSLTYRQQLLEVIRHYHFDVAIVDGMMAQYGHLLDNVKKCILDEVDIYSTVAFHTYLREGRIIQRWRSMFDWLYTYYCELSHIRRYDGVVTRSHEDKVFLEKLIPTQNFGVLPPWFEGLTEEFLSIPAQRPPHNRLLFVGAMANPKNVDAVVYFVKEILPIVQRQIPDVALVIAGSNPTSAVHDLAAVDGVEITGAVDSLTPFYAESAVSIVPLRMGGGVITKTLNGLAAARPTVSTTFGISGTGVKPGRDLIVADTPEQFAEAIIHLLQDGPYWLKIAQKGREFVKSHYNWQEAMGLFEAFIHSNC